MTEEKILEALSNVGHPYFRPPWRPGIVGMFIDVDATDWDEVAELENRQEPRLVRALEMVAPGTAVREGIDAIVQARLGACLSDASGTSPLGR